MEEMASRISSLEKSLAETVEARSTSGMDSEGPTGVDKPSPDQPLMVLEDRAHGLPQRSKDDVLVQNGSSSQYFNDVLLSRVLAEGRHVESVFTASPPVSIYPTLSPFSALGIISSPVFSQSPADAHPAKSVAIKLWNIYLHNIDGGVGLKLLHVPTDEAKVYTAIDRPREAPLEDHALCLAIFFAATITLDETEAQSLLGRDRSTEQLRFKAGLEQAFAQGDFLDHPTVTGLRAFVIYLFALRVENGGNSIWVLNGLAIRLAESMGLHRDGRRLGLSPFQSEIRRRLWWQILNRDGRAGEDYGLESTDSLLLNSDVALPLDVDDAHIYPEMEELPRVRPRWTAMSFVLVTIELGQAKQELFKAAASCSSLSPPREEERAQIIDKTRTKIEARLVHCNPVIPQQRMTMGCSRFLLRKLDFITRLRWLILKRPCACKESATDENLAEATLLLEDRSNQDDDVLQQFAWAKKLYPQIHVTLYTLWHLCIKPEGPNVSRAWKAIDTIFSGDQWQQFVPGFGSQAPVLAALRAKALSLREKKRSWDTVPSTENEESDLGMDTGGIQSVSEGLPDQFPGASVSGDFQFAIDNEEWPDWSILAQGFQADDPAFFGTMDVNKASFDTI